MFKGNAVCEAVIGGDVMSVVGRSAAESAVVGIILFCMVLLMVAVLVDA